MAGDAGGTKLNLRIGVDEKISVWQAGTLGLQNVLIMNFYIVPLMLGGMLGLTTGQMTLFISMTFITLGIATIIQAGFGIKLPVIQGPSFLPMGAMAVIGKTLGLGAMFGSLIPGAIIVSLLGPLKLMSKILKFLVTPLVAASVVMTVGVCIGSWGITDWMYADGELAAKGLIFIITITSLLIFFSLGQQLKNIFGNLFGVFAVLLSVVIGTLTAWAFGLVDFSPVQESAWFSLPHLFPFGAPSFNMSAILTMLIIYLALLLEAAGMWYAVGGATGIELDDDRLNGASLGEGLGCFSASLLGGMPVAGYSDNIGIITITGVASRWVAIATGCIAILMGLFPKLMSIFTCIPKSVLGSIVIVISAIILMNGVRMVKDSVELNERNYMVLGIPVITALGVTMLDPAAVETLPAIVQYFLGSAIAVGVLAVIVLNFLVPKIKEPGDEAAPKNSNHPA